jgi:ribonuclease HI
MTKEQVHIFTDGACSGNPGPGGYGIIMEWVGKNYKREFSEGYRQTTNNRMELLAVIVALEKMKSSEVSITVFSDSRYVVDAIEKNWLNQWERKQFKKVKNPDLWKRFLRIYNPEITRFEWVKGHNDHPQNERCDALAVAASKKEELLVDEGFEDKPRELFE